MEVFSAKHVVFLLHERGIEICGTSNKDLQLIFSYMPKRSHQSNSTMRRKLQVPLGLSRSKVLPCPNKQVR